MKNLKPVTLVTFNISNDSKCVNYMSHFSCSFLKIIILSCDTFASLFLSLNLHHDQKNQTHNGAFSEYNLCTLE